MDCMNWEEDMFWNHFQSIHFIRFLHYGFGHHLAIPEKFAKRFKKKLPESVTLKGPSGTTWNVELKTDHDALFFDSGWKDFLDDHRLEVNDLLVFKYNGVSHFDVLMFDGQNLCEKSASGFAQRSEQEEPESGCHEKRKAVESCVQTTHTSLHCDVEGTSQKPKNKNKGVDEAPFRQFVVSPLVKRKMRGALFSVKPVHTTQTLKSLELSDDSDGDVVVKHDPEHNPMVKRTPQQASNQKAVTDEEKLHTVHLAQNAKPPDGFVVVMKPTHVNKRHYIAIPSRWLNEHLSPENQDVILRVNEKTWKTKFYYIKRRQAGGLSGGWKEFVSDNHLEEFDVCVFEPTKPVCVPVTIDVKIFRVVQATIPVTQLSPEPKPESLKVVSHKALIP